VSHTSTREIQAGTRRDGTARIEQMVLIREREEVRGLADTLRRAEQQKAYGPQGVVKNPDGATLSSAGTQLQDRLGGLRAGPHQHAGAPRT
jgi:hypothetical protein